MNAGKAKGRFAVAAGMIAVMLGAPAAHAWTSTTPTLVPAPDGYLRCTVTALGNAPVSIRASIVDGAGADVTEFGDGFRTTTAEGYYAEESAGSFADVARACKVTVSGARRRTTEVTLTAHDAAGNPVASVTGR